MVRRVLPIVATLMAFASVAVAERPEVIDTTRSDSVTLQYQFSRGQSVQYQLSLTRSIEAVEGDDLRAALRMTAPVRYEVQSVSDDGAATVTTSFGVPSGSLTVDEEDEDLDDFAEVLESVRLTQVVRTNGSVTEPPEGLPDEGSVAGISNLVFDSVSMSWMEFPQGPVEIGHTWLQTVPLGMADDSNRIRANATFRYTLTGFAMVGGREHAVIDADLTHEIEGQVPLGREGVRMVSVVGRGDGDAYILFDHRAGTISEVGVDFGLVMTLTDPNGQRTTHTMDTQATLSSLSRTP